MPVVSRFVDGEEVSVGEGETLRDIERREAKGSGGNKPARMELTDPSVEIDAIAGEVDGNTIRCFDFPSLKH